MVDFQRLIDVIRQAEHQPVSAYKQAVEGKGHGQETNSRVWRERFPRLGLPASPISPPRSPHEHIISSTTILSTNGTENVLGAGSRICKVAIGRGWDVVSISRSGEPVWSSVTSSPQRPPWSSSVSWQKADILRPATYRSMLKDADAVVHSMGILLEADYKGVLTGKESIWSGLSRAFSTTKAGSQNPLERKEGEALEPQEKDGQLTYELMNRDTGVTLVMD